MVTTSRGLPNGCSVCGVLCVGKWYADSVDAARAGGGRCATCAGVELAPSAAADAAAAAAAGGDEPSVVAASDGSAVLVELDASPAVFEPLPPFDGTVERVSEPLADSATKSDETAAAAATRKRRSTRKG